MISTRACFHPFDNMRIALPTTDGQGMDGQVFAHFGGASHYVFVEVMDGEIQAHQVVKAPWTEHTHGQVPKFIQSLGTDVVIARGIGSRAVDVFGSMGIKVITGAGGRLEDVVNAYLTGTLQTDDSWMDEPGHSCGCGGQH